jgi:hypothetical protein
MFFKTRYPRPPLIDSLKNWSDYLKNRAASALLAGFSKRLVSSFSGPLLQICQTTSHLKPKNGWEPSTLKFDFLGELKGLVSNGLGYA